MKTPTKVIELSPDHTDTRYQYPYIQSYNSQIRFRLRSKITHQHQPYLLIETLDSFQCNLPLNSPINLNDPKCTSNFIVLHGKYSEDGAWFVELPSTNPGVISFQVVFVKEGEKEATKFGTHDMILLTQDKVDIRQLRKQTVFPRCIGRCTDWQRFFRRQMELGYNAFHLAPIQETGASKSYYSLRSHLQLSNDLFSGSTAEKYGQLEKILKTLQQEGAVFFIDIILNHTSFDSEWVRDEPDSIFTFQNTPMLYTALLVDRVIFTWGEEVKQMMAFQSQALELNEEILKQIEENLANRIEALNLHEYFMLSEEVQLQMLSAVPTRKPSQNIFAKDPIESIEQFLNEFTLPTTDQKGVQLKNIQDWKKLNLAYEEEDLKIGISTFNLKEETKIKDRWIPEIISNTMKSVKHNYFDNQYREFDDPYPLVNSCFSKVTNSKADVYYALNNGWISDADPTEMFVTSREYYYLRRKVNVWGDLLRIRYGDKPADSPAAWKHMTNYVSEMALHFDGFRMDNLHGTQLNVAKHLIKQARKVNPNLIIFAELFTNREEDTAVFVKNVGVNSVLKEAQHLLSGPSFISEFHRKIQKIKPYLGSLSKTFIENGQEIQYCLRKKPITLVYDLTHDNNTYISQKIHVLQTPVSFLLSLIGTFVGSTKGFDQFYTRKINVTELEPLYSRDIRPTLKVDKSEIQKIKIVSQEKSTFVYGSWDQWSLPHQLQLDVKSEKYVVEFELPPGVYEYKFKNEKEWFLEPKRKINASGNHEIVLRGGEFAFKQVYSNLEEMRIVTSKYSQKFGNFLYYHAYHIGNIVVMIREPEDNIESICVIANLSTESELLKEDIKLPGSLIYSDIWVQSGLSLYEGFITQSEIIRSHNLHEYFDLRFDQFDQKYILSADSLPAGFVCLIHCTKSEEEIHIIEAVKELLKRQLTIPPLGALDYNMIMFGIAIEEEKKYGQSNYTIPQDNNKQLVYAGFAGINQIINQAKRYNTLGIGLFNNLREGRWLFNYYIERLKRYKNLQSLIEMLQNVFYWIGQLPPYLIPKYFTEFMYSFIKAIENQASENGTDFRKKLALASTQFICHFPSTSDVRFQTIISAGLPHFAVDWARGWGRDTFISNELLLLHPSIYKETIIQYASALRHGLIPNLLDSGHKPRYNCRDASWWFIRAVSEYAHKTGDFQIFKNKVDMIFLSNDQMEHNRWKSQGKKSIKLVEDIIQEIFQAHVDGIFFREWNAGYEIDSNMSSDGFNIALNVDFDTGFIIGGNTFNCLTWMDKMGSSNAANTKGVPSTPRAGIPVELVGLLHNCLKSYVRLHKDGHYSHEGVVHNKELIPFSQWAHKIKHTFQREFFLHQRKQNREDSTYSRGIYKDLIASPLNYDEHRFRPNALIAMALAPEIFEQDHASGYLSKVESHLLFEKSIGVATLADNHSNYCPYYDNADQTSNPKTSHGFSYHNGPQWVWLYGFYLVAKVNFQGKTLNHQKMMALLQEHIKYIQNDQWCSLPEITNKNGEYNQFSCKAQAWSISSIIMALNAIDKLK